MGGEGVRSPLAWKIQTEKPRLFQAGSGPGSLALKEARPWGQGPGSSEHAEAASLGSRWGCKKLPTAHAWEAEQTARPKDRDLVRTQVTGGHPEPGATAPRRLPASKAQAPSQTVYVAPRALSFKCPSVIRLAGSILPRARAARGTASGGAPWGRPPGQHASPEWGRRASDSRSRLSPPTSEAKKDPHPDL